ncbi:ABC transporter substrate-binding protein [Nonomuraea pusilla]|uniref:Multiple sugar transport system substrate-binding protein n=1 Tax=Nonomuraea pusilla TaxID=46177 RepID=A0A1H8IFM7_9ACTN|nr:sugar ABC transporter substrate-binding protein [Nonomuraea pusilla]SEN67042.1 multiple sugar transport system substrate-binding protein [Nonomuraea pusilla]
MSTSLTSRRAFLGGSLLFVGGMALSACGKGDAVKAGAKVTLEQWYHAYGEAGTQQAVIRYAKEYTKANPDVAIKVNWIAGDYSAKLHSTLLTPQAPDLFEIGDFQYVDVKNGLLAPLDDIVKGQEAEYSKASLESATADGKLHGLKMMDDAMVLYYRKSVLEKAAVAPPQTFAELAAAAMKLTSREQKGLFVGSDGIGNAAYLLLWSNGGDLLDPEGRKVVFNSPEGVAAISGLKQLHDGKSLLLDFTTDWYDPGAFIQGAAAMQWCGLWAMPAIKKALGDDFGVLAWPKFGDSGRAVSRIGGWFAAVNAKGEHVEEAKKFVEWLWIKQAELQKDWCVSYGFHVPSRKSVAARTTEFTSGPAKDAADILANTGKAYPNLWNTAMDSAFAQAVLKIAKSGGDAKSLLDEAAAKAQAELDKQLA